MMTTKASLVSTVVVSEWKTLDRCVACPLQHRHAGAEHSTMHPKRNRRFITVAAVGRGKTAWTRCPV